MMQNSNIENNHIQRLNSIHEITKDERYNLIEGIFYNQCNEKLNINQKLAYMSSIIFDYRVGEILLKDMIKSRIQFKDLNFNICGKIYTPNYNSLYSQFVIRDFFEFLVSLNLDFKGKCDEGNNILHVAHNYRNIKLLVEKNLDVLSKNNLDNNPAQHYLHLHKFSAAYAVSQIGGEFTRNLKDEIIKELNEYIDLDVMNVYRYQSILNILHYKILPSNQIPENLLKYVNDNTVHIDQMKAKFDNEFIEEISWIKSQFGKIAEFFIQKALESQIQNIKVNADELDFLYSVFNPDFNVNSSKYKNFEEPKSYIGKVFYNSTIKDYKDLFIQVYSHIVHELNDSFMQENAILSLTPLEFFDKNISVYRGMSIFDLEEVNHWFKYGYESYSCHKYSAHYGWINNGHGIDLTPTSDMEYSCRSYTRSGLNAGVVYSSTYIPSTHRFSNGLYSSRPHDRSKYKIVIEFDAKADDVFLLHYDYECAVHKTSYKPSSVKAVYILNNEKKIINPYLDNPILNYEKDKIDFADAVKCPYFENINKIYNGKYQADNLLEYRNAVDLFNFKAIENKLQGQVLNENTEFFDL